MKNTFEMIKLVLMCAATLYYVSFCNSENYSKSLDKVLLVTQFDTSNSDRALLIFRSFGIAASRRTNPYRYTVNPHVCVSNSNHNATDFDRSKFEDAGIHVHILHDLSYTDSPKNTTSWRNLICATQIADYQFTLGILDAFVLFVDVKFVFVGSLESTYFITQDTNTFIYCAKKVPPRTQKQAQSYGVCEMDLFAIPTLLGTELYSVINATSLLDIPADIVLDMASSSISDGILLFKDKFHTVRSHYHWSSLVPSSEVSLIEFDGDFHRITFENCIPRIHVEWRMYNTVDILVETLSHVYANETLLYQLSGCTEGALDFITPSYNVVSLVAPQDSKFIPHIYDSVLFNDEVDLLLLRMSFLDPFVDFHIVVEAKKTFTGNLVALSSTVIFL